MTSTPLPTAEEVAAAQALLTRSATAKADDAKAALIVLVTMPEYSTVADSARAALALSPGNVDLGYVLSMMERLRAMHAPR
jgi:O-methyltransferase involved in polyketide biosynthesis